MIAAAYWPRTPKASGARPPVSGVSGPMRVSRRRAPGGRSYFSPPDSTSSPSSSSSPASAAGVTVVVPRVGATEGGAAPLVGAGVGVGAAPGAGDDFGAGRSEEHTSELQSLMRISYAVF